VAGPGRVTRALRRYLVPAAAVLAVAGCSAPGSRLEAPDAVRVTPIGAIVHAPVWSYRSGALVALAPDRVVKVNGLADGRGDTVGSARLPGLGPNLQISPVDEGTALVSATDRQAVASIRLSDLVDTGTLSAGPRPSYLALDSGERMLLALSEDGATVTPVDLHRRTAWAPTVVNAGPQARLDGANRSREVEFHIYGPRGSAHYKGSSSPADETGADDEPVLAAAGDGTKVTRLYVARPGGRLVALDSRRDGSGSETVGSVDLGAPIRYLATDDTRIYAATDRQLVVLETRSFEGYANGTIPVLRRFDLPTRGAQGSAWSGIAVGPHRVYLTVRDRPEVVSVAKPQL